MRLRLQMHPRQLIQTVIDIALWRRGPQDLPASYPLTACVGLAYALMSFAHILLFDWGAASALRLVAIDTGMLCVWVWLLLYFFSRPERFLQTIAAVWGVCALLTLFDIVFAATQILLSGKPQAPALLILLRFIAVVLIVGRILRSAIDAGALTGVALTVAIVFSIDRVVALAMG